MERKNLAPRSIIEINGKVVYSESMQAWSQIALKKDFLNEFPLLKEKRSKFSYEIKFFRTKEDMEKTIKKLNKDETMPMLMFIYKNDRE